MKPKMITKSMVRRRKDSLSVSEVKPSGYGTSADYLRTIIDSLEAELMVINRDYRIIEANNMVLRRYGKKREEIIGRYCYAISHGLAEPCQLPYHECPVTKVWETGKPVRTTHLHTYNVKGEKCERYLDIIASPITDSQGKVSAIAELMRDVTEAKKLESEVAKAHRDLSALNTIAYVVSQSLDLDTVLGSALDKTLEIMKIDTGGILLWDEEKQALCYRVYHGLSREYVQGVCCRLGEGIAGRAAQTGETILVEDISTEPRAICSGLINAEGLRAFASIPLRSQDKVSGVLNVASREAHKFSSEDIQLLNSIAAQIAIAIENAKLHQEVQRKEEIRGELLENMFTIQEEERRRLARELHDETSQVMASLNADLEVVAGMLPASADQAKSVLRKAQELSVNILDELHKLIYELRPTLLDDLGLVAAIRWLADNNLESAGIKVDFKTTGLVRRLDTRLETTLFRVIQEAFYNIAKHAEAISTEARLGFKKSAIKVRISDNGKGFDVIEAMSSKDRPRGLGLLGMKERVELVKGTFSIHSSPGSGTEINIEIPLSQKVVNE